MLQSENITSPAAQTGIIAGLLLKEGLITEQQLSYAIRVRSKLTS